MVTYLWLCAVILVLTYYLWKRNSTTFAYWKKCGIPVLPGCRPFVGHVGPLVFVTEHMGDLYKYFYQACTNSSMVGISVAGTPALVLRDPELVKTVLQTNFTSFFENTFPADPRLDPLLAGDPFYLSGESWRVTRQNLTYAFTSNKLKILMESVDNVCKKFSNFLSKKTAECDSVECELKDLFTRFVGEVAASTGFGVDGHCFETEDDTISFKKVGDTLFNADNTSSLLYRLSFFYPVIKKLFQVHVVPKEVDHFFRQLVNKIIKETEDRGVNCCSYVQLLLNCSKSKTGEVDYNSILHAAFNFFFDSYETPSAMLTIFGYHLAAHPDIQQKVRDEVLSVLSKSNGVISYEAVHEMTYLEQVIYESMRMFPGQSIIGRKCMQETELKGFDGISCRVKPGIHVYISVTALHNDPKYWIDPNTFDPERFGPDKKNDIPKNCFIPFGTGPKACIGMRMILLHMKAALATFLRNYSVELSPRTQVPLKMNPVTLFSNPIGGVWVHIKRL